MMTLTYSEHLRLADIYASENSWDQDEFLSSPEILDEIIQN